MQSVNQRVNIGSLHAGERQVMPVSLVPESLHTMDAVNGKIPRCLIYITQQNFTTEEILDFTKDSSGNWKFRYKAFKQPPDVNRAGKIRGVIYGPIIEAADWSTDMNQPHRTTAKKATEWH